VTPSVETDGPPRGRGPGGIGRSTWARVATLVIVLGLAFVVSRSCQQSQIRLTKEQAIAAAERRIDFDPARTQVRLLRQGLGSQPFWVVSLSIPTGDRDRFRRLAVVRVDANTGEVADVKEQRPLP
jgi:hypothetical protein